MDEELEMVSPEKGRTRSTSIELYEQSRKKANSGDVAGALVPALEALNGKTKRPGHYEHAARLLMDLGLVRVMELVVRDALAHGFEKPAFHSMLARGLHRQGNFAEALAHFDAAVALAPENEGLVRFRDKVAARVQAGAAASGSPRDAS